MNTAILKQVPKGEDLTRAIGEVEEREYAEYVKKQIQRGLDMSNNPAAPRTSHAKFMAELKEEIMSKINAR
jgi:hypothetical protein